MNLTTFKKKIIEMKINYNLLKNFSKILNYKMHKSYNFHNL